MKVEALPDWVNFKTIDGAGESWYEYAPSYDEILQVWISKDGKWCIGDSEAKTDINFRDTLRGVNRHSTPYLAVVVGDVWKHRETAQDVLILATAYGNGPGISVRMPDGKVKQMYKRDLRKDFEKVLDNAE